jgi:MFS family permease
MVGMLFGSFFAGRLIDWIGRRKGLVVFVTIGAIGAIANAFTHGYEMFCAARFVTAVGE